MLRMPVGLITFDILQAYRCVRLVANRRSIPDVSRRERIGFLLDNYSDVLQGNVGSEEAATAYRSQRAKPLKEPASLDSCAARRSLQWGR